MSIRSGSSSPARGQTWDEWVKGHEYDEAPTEGLAANLNKTVLGSTCHTKANVQVSPTPIRIRNGSPSIFGEPSAPYRGQHHALRNSEARSSTKIPISSLIEPPSPTPLLPSQQSSPAKPKQTIRLRNINTRSSSRLSALSLDESLPAVPSSPAQQSSPIQLSQIRRILCVSAPPDWNKPEQSSQVEESSPVKHSATADETDDEDEINPEDIPREFFCVNDPQIYCVTGQYTLDLSRKVITDYFGRNKACTLFIKWWPLMCRKHYQRATYHESIWQKRKLAMIWEQFDVIEKQFPGVLYTVGLKKSEEDRINLYSRKIAQGVSEIDAAKFVESADAKHKSHSAPINILCQLEKSMGANKNVQDVKNTVEQIEKWLVNGEISKIPCIEFLPQIGSDSAIYTERDANTPKPRTPRKAAGTRASNKGSVKKSASESPNKAAPKTPKKAASSRVSYKGSVKKPTPKRSPNPRRKAAVQYST